MPEKHLRPLVRTKLPAKRIRVILAILLIVGTTAIFSALSRSTKRERAQNPASTVTYPATVKPTATTSDLIIPQTGIPAREPGAQVQLYGVFETRIQNNTSYSNPYDYQVIELQAKFTAPSGSSYSFFGFYDGDGNGGLSGNIWRLRFMPNESGRWNYAYTWTDGTPGGSGNFDVVDTGLPGPLQVASDRSWFFQTARGAPFHWRGYSLHLYLHGKYGRGIFSDEGWSDLQNVIRTKVADRGYNAVMLRWPTITRSGEDYQGDNAGHHFWQQNGSEIDFSRFYIPQWQKIEETLEIASARYVYVFQFVAMLDQYTLRPGEDQMAPFLRYMAARQGPYWNNFGYSLTWEYIEIADHGTVDDWMSIFHENLRGLPVKPLLSVHDHSNDRFDNWLGFSMRQRGATNVFEGNCRPCGQHGGVGAAFVAMPIVGSEDIWETGITDLPDNGIEVRRGAWGSMLAGILPVYLEDTGASGIFDGQGHEDIVRLYDYFYTFTQYRQYKPLNSLVAKDNRQVAAGIPGIEYLVYDEDGGTVILDLSDAPSRTIYAVTWYNPANGEIISGAAVRGGGSQNLTSPFSQDSVLLLKAGAGAVPSAPRNAFAYLPLLTKRKSR